MKKIIILSLVAATHMFAFEVSEAEIISKDDQTYSKVTLGDTSFDYASSKDNKALFTQKYCDNGDEGYSVILSNDNVSFKMQYDSCTGETSMLNPPQTAEETAASINGYLSNTFKKFTGYTSSRALYDAVENTMTTAGYVTASSTAVTFDEKGNFVGNGIFLFDIDGDGKNDYQTYSVGDIGLDNNYCADAQNIDNFKNVERLKTFDNAEMATGLITKVEFGRPSGSYSSRIAIVSTLDKEKTDIYFKNHSPYNFNTNKNKETTIFNYKRTSTPSGRLYSLTPRN